ncbi:MAG: glycosyltransferase family 4 protein [Candidatus Aminicenantaceae bacterium]
MRIGYDLRPFLKEETGVGVYFKNLLFHLAEIDKENEYFLFTSSFKDRFIRSQIPPFEKKQFKDFMIPVKAVNYFWYRLNWPPLDYLFKTKLDISHSPTPLILPTKGKKIVTICDLFFMDFPKLTDKDSRSRFAQKIDSSLEKADGIITISNYTKKQILQRFELNESKVKVIYLGVEEKYGENISRNDVQKIKRRYSLPSNFLLFTGSLEPRKNVLKLVDALKLIHKEHHHVGLVLVGKKGRDYNKVKDKVKQENLDSWVKIIGYVSEKELKSLYKAASVFVFPSLCEGFGLPVLEALASGLPAVVSDNSAFPEIAEDCALYFNSQNAEEVAEKIIKIWKDKTLRKKLQELGKKRAEQFSWKRTADETLKYYKLVLG